METEEILNDLLNRTYGKIHDLQKITNENWFSALGITTLLLVITIVALAIIFYIFSKTTRDFKPLPRVIILGYPLILLIYFSLRGLIMFITVLLSSVVNVPIVGFLAKILIFIIFYFLSTIESWEFIFRLPIWIFSFLITVVKNFGGQTGVNIALGLVGIILIMGLIWKPRTTKQTEQ